jgi:hypothetical protein
VREIDIAPAHMFGDKTELAYAAAISSKDESTAIAAYDNGPVLCFFYTSIASFFPPTMVPTCRPGTDDDIADHCKGAPLLFVHYCIRLPTGAHKPEIIAR